MVLKIGCGKGDLNEFDKDLVKRISEEYEDKIKREFDEVNSDVRLKCFSKEGKVKRYAVDIRLVVPGSEFNASGEGYDLKEAVQGAYKKIMSEIEHRLHVSSKRNAGMRR